VGDLTWAKASWETFRGPVSVAWRIEGGAFLLSVDIPPGMTAEIRLPSGAVSQAASGHHELRVDAFRRR
jgi:alpha-L-rhamnosidase